VYWDVARPKKSLHEKRIATIKADVTLAEKVLVQQQAEAAELSEAEFTRRRVLGKAVPSNSGKDDAMLIMELNRLGVAFQQNTDAVSCFADTDVLYQHQLLTEQLATVLGKVLGV